MTLTDFATIALGVVGLLCVMLADMIRPPCDGEPRTIANVIVIGGCQR
jgi:hypothetical protein